MKRTSSELLSFLKHEAFASRRSIADVSKIEPRLMELIPDLPQSSLLDAAYYCTRILRRVGFILNPRVFQAILSRIQESVCEMDRNDLIRLIQVCSFAVSKRKILTETPEYMELKGTRDRITVDAIRVLSRRVVDLPTSSLGVMFSSLCRVFLPDFMAEFIHEVTGVITDRIQFSLHCPCPQGASATLARGELLKCIPYMLIGYSQIGVTPPKDFQDSAVCLFSEYVEEVAYSHLSQFVYGMGACGIHCGDSQRLVDVLKYSWDKIVCDAENFTLMDLARTCTGMSMVIFSDSVDVECVRVRDNTVREVLRLAVDRPTKQWDMHAVLELSRLGKTNNCFPSPFLAKFEQEIRKLGSVLPVQYAVEIFCNFSLNVHVPIPMKLYTLSLAQAQLRNCPPDHVVMLLECLGKEGVPEKILLSRTTAGIARSLLAFRESNNIFFAQCEPHLAVLASRNKKIVLVY